MSHIRDDDALSVRIYHTVIPIQNKIDSIQRKLGIVSAIDKNIQKNIYKYKDMYLEQKNEKKLDYEQYYKKYQKEKYSVFQLPPIKKDPLFSRSEFQSIYLNSEKLPPLHRKKRATN